MSVRLAAGERALLEALRGLRFGSVEAVVHDGKIQRIERKEKFRVEDDPTTEDLDAIPNPNRKLPDRRSSLANSTEEQRCGGGSRR